jgi:hypothetical protein
MITKFLVTVFASTPRRTVVKHIQTFPCGHRGCGQSCHRCAQQAQQAHHEAAARAAQQQLRNDWKARFTTDPINLHRLPQPALVIQARQVIAAMTRGQDYRALGGKQLAKCPSYVSIPLRDHYRIIFRRTAAARFEPHGVYSHETYNRVVGQLKRTG